MKVLLISASPDPASKFSRRLNELKSYLNDMGDSPAHFELTELKINFCIGCFNCWWKNPGRCIHSDSMEEIYPQITGSDLMIFASPLSAGLPSWPIKAFMDRIIPLVHPYIEIRSGECHHEKRYAAYPDIALLVEKEPDTETEDIDILRELYQRFALNFHSKLRSVSSLEMKNEEIYNEFSAS